MPTTLEKIQATAKRIERLGKYLINTQTVDVSKQKGVLCVTYHSPVTQTLECTPHTGRDPTGDSPERLLEKLQWFEERAMHFAKEKARQDILDELVTKRLNRILKAKRRNQ
jgi:hypothetical protein